MPDIGGVCLLCGGWQCGCEYEAECNGICLTPADIGLPEYGGPGVVAYAHPDCPEHGNPQEYNEAEDTCSPGEYENERFVRFHDIETLGCPPGCTSPFCDCPGND